ncbi:MAG TPA: CoA transferase [Gaiellaceae bacterium]|jgi:crotonobetainyl-CoA:carnitine CoA-transferase CaiB-like acyl-CoA transferase
MGASALEGLLVVDLSRVLAGPLVAMTLGDLGAEVIKIESPSGDDTRSWGPPFDAEGRATYHHAANRNKRSVALDLSQPSGRELALRLCSRADVVVSNFRVGTLERFGLGYDQVAAENAGVVYCEVSGFGERAGRDLPGYDPLVQALGGLMSVTGPPGAPSKVGVALIDVIAGLYGATAVLAALHERAASGSGQRVTLNLMHVSLAALVNQATGWLGAAAEPVALGNVHPSIEPFSTYAAADGELMICVGNDRQFEALAKVVGLEDDDRFRSNADRVGHRAALRELLEQRLATRSCSEWTSAMSAAGVPAGPVQSVPAAFALAEALELDAVDETGGVRTVAFPASLSRTPATVRRRPPALDEHGDEIRQELR